MSYRDTWNQAAEGDFRHAILTNADEAAFEQSGSDDAKLLRAVFEQFAQGPLEGALDFGCGAGRILKPLLLEQEAPFGIGIDVSPKMLDLARQRIGLERDRLRLMTYNESQIQVPADVSVQLAYSWLCLQHMEYPHAFHALRELQTALDPGGIFVGTLPNAEHEAYWQCITIHETHAWPLPIAHVRVYTPDLATLFMERAGFTEVQVTKGNPDGIGGARATVSPAELLVIGRKA